MKDNVRSINSTIRCDSVVVSSVIAGPDIVDSPCPVSRNVSGDTASVFPGVADASGMSKTNGKLALDIHAIARVPMEVTGKKADAAEGK